MYSPPASRHIDLITAGAISWLCQVHARLDGEPILFLAKRHLDLLDGKIRRMDDADAIWIPIKAWWEQEYPLITIKPTVCKEDLLFHKPKKVVGDLLVLLLVEFDKEAGDDRVENDKHGSHETDEHQKLEGSLGASHDVLAESMITLPMASVPASSTSAFRPGEMSTDRSLELNASGTLLGMMTCCDPTYGGAGFPP